MAIFADESESWKCMKHPSKRRSSGVCPICLRDRLVDLCSDCAHARPCSCRITASSSSSSKRSSLSCFNVGGDCSGNGTVGLVSEWMENETTFRRSRSKAVPLILRSQSKWIDIDGDKHDSDPYAHDSKQNRPATLFLSLFRKGKKAGVQTPHNRKMAEVDGEHEQQVTGKSVMSKSRSMAAPIVSNSSSGEWIQSENVKGWYFPSPSKVFRQAKLSKISQQWSPMYRS